MKHRNLLIIMLIATAMTPLAPSARAHHSFAAEYDANKPVTLTGSVTKMAWINPHSWVYIDVKTPAGGERLSRKGRSFESERTRYYVAGWAIALRGRIKPRRAEGLSGDQQVRKCEHRANTVSACGNIEEAQHG
jgi:hypothetical protein